MNYKGVWYRAIGSSEYLDETASFTGDPYIPDKTADAFTVANASDNDTNIKLCYAPENFKYDARARDYIGNLVGYNGDFWEFKVELKVGSYDGATIAKWHGYEIYGQYRYVTYADGNEIMWTQLGFINFVGKVHSEHEYIEFETVANVEGYTNADGGWICTDDSLDIYVVRTAVGTSHQYNRSLKRESADPYKMPERAWNTVQSTIAGYPRYWWYCSISEDSPMLTLLINGNVKATVFDGLGKLIDSGYDMRLDMTYDENLNTNPLGQFGSKHNKYFILLEEQGVQDPDCKMNLFKTPVPA